MLETPAPLDLVLDVPGKCHPIPAPALASSTEAGWSLAADGQHVGEQRRPRERLPSLDLGSFYFQD